jgi:predicted Zn-ribbon and HTH transcriptional regulator
MNKKDSGTLLLEQLENLAALSNNYGLIEIKPFRSWKGSNYWSNTIFKLRLCNAGEILELSSYCDQFTSTAQEYAIKIDTVIRSLHEINGIGIGTSEQLIKYNKDHNTSLTRTEYLRIWAKNLEQFVIDTLYTTYVALQLKQVRLVMNQVMCESCGMVYEKDKTPEGSREIIYSTGEIVCGHCIKNINLEDFDFKEINKKIETVEKVSEQAQEEIHKEKAPHICACQQEFDTLEEFTSHRISCPEANK